MSNILAPECICILSDTLIIPYSYLSAVLMNGDFPIEYVVVFGPNGPGWGSSYIMGANAFRSSDED